MSPRPFHAERSTEPMHRRALACRERLAAAAVRLSLLAGARRCRAAALAADADRGEGASSAPPATARRASRINKTTPVIWGQNEGYLYLQLRDFKSGARKNDADGAHRRRRWRRTTCWRLPPISPSRNGRTCSSLRRRTTSPPRRRPPAASVGCPGCHLDSFPGRRHHGAARRPVAGISAARRCWTFATARAATIPACPI